MTPPRAATLQRQPSINLVRSRAEVLDAFHSDVKRQVAEARARIEAAECARRCAVGKAEIRKARRERDAAVVAYQDACRRSGDVKRERNAVNADRNDAVTRAFANIVVERVDAATVSEFWKEAERRVADDRQRAADMAGKRASGSAIEPRATSWTRGSDR